MDAKGTRRSSETGFIDVANNSVNRQVRQPRENCTFSIEILPQAIVLIPTNGF